MKSNQPVIAGVGKGLCGHASMIAWREFACVEGMRNMCGIYAEFFSVEGIRRMPAGVVKYFRRLPFPFVTVAINSASIRAGNRSDTVSR